MALIDIKKIANNISSRLWLPAVQTTNQATSLFTQQRESHSKYGKDNEKTFNNKKLYAVVAGATVAATYGLYKYSTGKYLLYFAFATVYDRDV